MRTIPAHRAAWHVVGRDVHASSSSSSVAVVPIPSTEEIRDAVQMFAVKQSADEQLGRLQDVTFHELPSFYVARRAELAQVEALSFNSIHKRRES